MCQAMPEFLYLVSSTFTDFFYYDTLHDNNVLFANSDFFAAIALELAEEPYELVTVRESRGRHKRSLQAPLPDQLNVEFTLQHSTVKLRLRRNTRMQRQIPVIFEEEPEKIIYVSMEEVTMGYWFVPYRFAVAPHRRNATLR